MQQEILLLEPVFTHNIWGGTKLRTEYGYNIEGDDIGECWGISAHSHGDCKIKDGAYKGQTLSQLWTSAPELFGHFPGERFPLLVKIIDARNDLSIQVHPDDEYAKKNEDGSLGKTECWYILDCEENSTLVIGHNAETKDELNDMISKRKWNDFIREIPVTKGDFIQINSGTVHAIKGGILLLETQQNSDITYRVYDYDRLSNGKPRQLHIEKSIDVIQVPATSTKDSVVNFENVEKNCLHEMIACKYYRVFKIDIEGAVEYNREGPFMLMTVIDGEGTINGITLVKGEHLIIPNGIRNIKMNGKMQIIASTV